MLRAFVRPVATLCHALGVASRTGAHGATLLHNLAKRVQHHATPHKCCEKNLAIFKLEPTIPIMSLHIATG